MANPSTPDPANPPKPALRKQFDGRSVDQDEIADGRDDTDLPTAASEPDVSLGGDTGFDRIVGPEEAGLGGGLDQAEEARLGVTDEELAEMVRHRRQPDR